MDFRELQYIVTVADCQSVTTAAKQLYISQPSLSYAISQIEKEVGTKLFDRSQHPFVLTDAGRIYVQSARDILQRNTEMKSRLADLESGQGAQISLGIPAERAGHMLPAIINEFRKAFPNSAFNIQEAGTGELVDYVLNNRVSFLIVPLDREELPPNLIAELIYKESIQLIAAPNAFPDDVFIDKAARLVDLKKLADMPYIDIKKRHQIHKKAQKILQEYGIVPHTLMEVDSTITAAQLAACGLGFTLVADRARTMLGPSAHNYCYRYSSHPTQWEINAVYKKDTYLNKAERYFIDLMKENFGHPE